jgi:hypothetical protein
MPEEVANRLSFMEIMKVGSKADTCFNKSHECWPPLINTHGIGPIFSIEPPTEKLQIPFRAYPRPQEGDSCPLGDFLPE